MAEQPVPRAASCRIKSVDFHREECGRPRIALPSGKGLVECFTRASSIASGETHFLKFRSSMRVAQILVRVMSQGQFSIVFFDLSFLSV